MNNAEDKLPGASNPGPLHGLRVVELAGLGPAPFAAMHLAELGADVIRIDRPGGSGILTGSEVLDFMNRGKRSVLLDLKQPQDLEVALKLIESSDILIEGYRPGVAEKLGVGPDVCLSRNQELIYGRMTGWGQSGPLAHTAGHDVDYIALTGALDAIGTGDTPIIPLNLIGDFGGGATYLVIGILAALREKETSGRGQVIDAAIVDGTSHLMTAIHTLRAVGAWKDERGVNLLDGGAPYYAVYKTADNKHMAVGAIEPQFYKILVEQLEVDLDPRQQNTRSQWAEARTVFADAFRTRSQSEWTAIFEGVDACVAPILNTENALENPHISSRGTLYQENGHIQAATAPRFSRSVVERPSPPPTPGQHTQEVLREVLGEEADLRISDTV